MPKMPKNLRVIGRILTLAAELNEDDLAYVVSQLQRQPKDE